VTEKIDEKGMDKLIHSLNEWKKESEKKLQWNPDLMKCVHYNKGLLYRGSLQLHINTGLRNIVNLRYNY